MLTKVKDPVPPEGRMGVICNIRCIGGDVYIREISQLMSTRIKEHKAAYRLRNDERSAVAEHIWQNGHNIEWDVKILDTAMGVISQRTEEGMKGETSLRFG